MSDAEKYNITHTIYLLLDKRFDPSGPKGLEHVTLQKISTRKKNPITKES